MRGGTNTRYQRAMADMEFQSARPVRGGTSLSPDGEPILKISIRPPRAGRDLEKVLFGILRLDFNPPAPCGAGPLIKSEVSR